MINHTVSKNNKDITNYGSLEAFKVNAAAQRKETPAEIQLRVKLG